MTNYLTFILGLVKTASAKLTMESFHSGIWIKVALVLFVLKFACWRSRDREGVYGVLRLAEFSLIVELHRTWKP